MAMPCTNIVRVQERVDHAQLRRRYADDAPQDIDVRCGRCGSQSNLDSLPPVLANIERADGELRVCRVNKGPRTGKQPEQWFREERGTIEELERATAYQLTCFRCRAKPTPARKALGLAYRAAIENEWPYLLCDHLARLTG